MRNILLRLIFTIRIIRYKFEKMMNKKSLFEFVIINLNIK